MKTHKMLPLYLLQGDGTVIEIETGEIVQMINRTEYRLQTSETVYLETKGKTIELVRRFTKEQIIKMWKDGKPYKQVTKNTDKTISDEFVNMRSEPLNSDLTNSDEFVIDNKAHGLTNNEYKFVINGQEFVTVQQACDELGMSRSTVDRRIKSDDYPTYYKIE